MKYKLIGAASILIGVAAALGAMIWQLNMNSHSRVHQHLETAEKEVCTLDHNDGTFCTHLPLIVINTGGQTIPGIPTGSHDAFGEAEYSLAPDGSSMITVSMDVFDSQTSYNHPTDVPTISTLSQMRIRGHSSRRFEKAPYLLKLVTEDGLERDEAMLGMGEHDEWVLHGPYLDKSLIRNYVFYNLSGEMMDYAPNCRFCELIIDGDYRGIYLLTETITASEDGRLPIVMKKKNSALAGYLLRIDRPTRADLETVRDVDTFTERGYIQRMDVEIRYPGINTLTEDMRRRIELDFSQFEKSVYSFDYDSKKYGYRQYVDVDSFINYYIINSLTANTDAGRFSTYLYKALGGKYKFCVWDFNNACDNFVSDALGYDEDVIREYVYFSMMFRDRYFVDRVIERYHELREGILSDEYLDQYIDDTIAFLGDAVDRDSARWAAYLASDPLNDEEGTGRNDHSHEEAVQRVKDYLHGRGQWLDENIDYLYQYCAASANKTYSENPE